MAKRSTNFNPGKQPIRPSSFVELARWLGMTDEEIKKSLEDTKARLDARKGGK